MREAGTILADLSLVILDECARSVPDPEDTAASGTGFEVLVYVGDEFISKHKDTARGKIVLCVGDVRFDASNKLSPRISFIGNACPTFEAHLWTPAQREDRGEDPLSGARKIGAHLRMVECIVRAISGTHHGATMPQSPPVDSLRLERDVRVLRHGQASILTFPLALAIVRGQPLQTLPDGSSIGTVGVNGSLNVNPEP